MVRVGLEICLDEPPDLLRGARFGLLMNVASVDRRFHYAHDLLVQRFPGQLRALFSPQHGLWAERQDNMVESPSGVCARLGLPVHSLYSNVRRPTPQMLRDLDALVVDLQDVGTRVYTFIWTISYCLESCAQTGIPLIVLDRPNPLGGEVVEGRALDPEFASFVGRAAIPMRHALTVGELSCLVNEMLAIRANVYVVVMEGWRREMWFSETGRPWVAPSPNLPRLESVAVYPGQVLLEGTNLSEGRGTTTPFEVFGAPFIDPHRLQRELERYELPGVVFRPVHFEPTFQKWAGRSCGGLFLHVTDLHRFRSYRTTLAILAAVRRLWKNDFSWRQPPYEYESIKLPIDILTGSRAVRDAVENDAIQNDADLAALSGEPSQEWQAQALRFQLGYG
jgi:uncharacterized protein YbbC (DUF1343 family)